MCKKTIIKKEGFSEYLSKISNPPIGSFDVKGTFNKWDSNHSELILVELENINSDEYYCISLCNFCKTKRLFEIHIEKIEAEDVNEDSIKYKYTKAKSEGFDLTTPINNTDRTKDVQVKILTYNTDPNDLEEYYLKCNNKGDLLKFPKKKSNALNVNLGLTPKVKKGNILQGGD